MNQPSSFAHGKSTYCFKLTTEPSAGIEIKHTQLNEPDETLFIPQEALLEWLSHLAPLCESFGALAISPQKSNYMEKQKQLHKNAYQKWSSEEDATLTDLFNAPDFDRAKAAETLGRNKGAIQSRLKKLGLLKP